MQAFHQNKIFSGLLAVELHALEQTSRLQKFAAGTTIFREGDAGDGIYLINEGLVQISAVIGEGERRVLARIGPGDFFGEMAVLEQRPRSASAIAEQPTCAWFVPSAELLKMLDRSPRLAASLLREVSQRLRDFDRQYVQELLQAERLGLIGRFTRSILHDLKSPLTVIALGAEMGFAPTATPETRKTAALRIRKQIERVTTMINELMEFSRGGQSDLQLTEIEFAPFITQLLEELQLEVEMSSVKVTVQPPPRQITVRLDPRRLANVFFNLAHNAVDAMPSGGEIKFRFQLAPQTLTMEIEDTGPGFAPEIVDRLFQPFATYGKTTGTGLGLSICKKILEDHGGRIEALRRPGCGAIFAITLPRE